MKQAIIILFILFCLSVSAAQQVDSLCPASVLAGEQFIEFNFSITNLGGKVDSLILTNPAADQPVVVVGILKKGKSKSLVNQASRPADSTYCSWNYDPLFQKLTVRADTSGFSDSLRIEFVQDMPTIVKKYPYRYTYGIRKGGNVSDSCFVSVIHGMIGQIKIETAMDGSGAEIDTVCLNADSSMLCYSVGRDNFGNYADFVSADWQVESSIGTLSPSVATDNATFNPSVAGTGRIRATWNSFTDVTGAIRVIPGKLNHIVIRLGSNNGGDALHAASITTDSALVAYAAGYDKKNNYIGDVNAVWRTTGSLDLLGDSTGSSVFFKPLHAGRSGTLTAFTSDTAVNSGISGIISTLPGAITRLVVADGYGDTVHSLRLTTDNGAILTVRGYDAGGNFVDSVQAAWSDSGNMGTVSPINGYRPLFTPDKIGSGLIRADWDGLSAAIYVDVTGGALDHLVIRSAANGGGVRITTMAISTDSTAWFFAAGYDKEHNYLRDVTSHWRTINGLEALRDSVGGSIVFQPAHAGTTGQIVADTADGTVQGDSTDTISIMAGAISRLIIADGNGDTVHSLHLTADDEAFLTVKGYDSDGNIVDTVQAVWSDSGNTGTLTPINGFRTRFTANRIGGGCIRADWDGLIAAIYVDVSGGALDHLVIRSGANGGGDTVKALTLSTDTTLWFFTAGYDKDDNYLRDVAAHWRTIGGLEKLSDSIGASIVFQPAHAGTSGQIVADTAGGAVQGDSTGTITVLTGIISRLVIADGNGDTVHSLHLTADEEPILTVRGYDADGNFVDTVQATWSDSGNTGSITPIIGCRIRFSANRIGGGCIRADWDGLTAAIYVDVSGGTLDHLVIRSGANGGGDTVEALTLSTDTTLWFFAAGYDKDNNFLRDVQSHWSSIDGLEPLSDSSGDSIVFQPARAGTAGKIAADTAGGVGGDSTGVINVLTGTITRLIIADTLGDTVHSLHMTTDDIAVMTVGGYDADGNFVDTVQAIWSDSGNIGVFSSGAASRTQFTAHRIGGGAIRADWKGLGTCIYVDVSGGILAHLVIRSGAHDGGDAVRDVIMPADSSLALFAAGYDRFENYLRDIQVHWHTNDGPGIFRDSTGSSTIFYPGMNAGGYFAWADSGGVIDSTGMLTILSPALLQYVPASLSPLVLYANTDTAFQFTLSNSGDIPLTIDTASYLFFADNSGDTVKAKLSDSVSIGRSGAAAISTVSITLPSTFGGETYTPYLSASGRDSLDRPFANMVIPMEQNSLIVAIVKIISVTAEKKYVSVGQPNLSVKVLAEQFTPDTIGSLQGSALLFSPRPLMFHDTLMGSDTVELPPRQPVTLNFRVSVDMGATPALDTIHFVGTGIFRGIPLHDTNPFVYDTWLVMYPPDLSYRSASLNTTKVTQGQLVSFEVNVENTGETGIDLDSTQSSFGFSDGLSGYSAALAQHLSLARKSTKILSFVNTRIPGSITNRSHFPELNLAGVDSNGLPYSRKFQQLPDSIIVQEPVGLMVYDSTLHQDTVTQGEQVSFHMVVRDTGDASALLTNNQTQIHFGRYRADLIGDTLVRGKSDTMLTFMSHVVDDSFPSGRYTAIVDYEGNDDNGQHFKGSDAADSVSLVVQTPSWLVYDGFLSPSRVTAGKYAAFRLHIRNRGEAGVNLFHDQCRCILPNANGDSMKPRLRSDASIPGGATNFELSFDSVKISFSTPDTIVPYLDLMGTDYNGAAYRDSMIRLDTVFISQPRLTAVTGVLHPLIVSQGQPQIGFGVKVHNSGTIAIQLDTVTQFILPGRTDSVHASLMMLPPKISIKDTVPLNFAFTSIPASFDTGYSRPLLLLHGHDGNGEVYADTLYLKDSVLVQQPPDFRYILGSENPKSVTRDQDSVRFTLVLENRGRSTAVFDHQRSLLFLTLGIDTIHGLLLSPDFLIPGARDTFHFAFMKITQLPTGKYPIHIVLNGADANGKSFRAEVTTDDSVNIEDNIQFAPIQYSIIPDSITQGQKISFSVLLRIDGAFKEFYNSSVLVFGDSLHDTVRANLRGAPDTLGDVYRFTFDSIFIPETMIGQSYAPVVTLIGKDKNENRFHDSVQFVLGNVSVDSLPKFSAYLKSNQSTFTQGGDKLITFQVFVVTQAGDPEKFYMDSTWAEFPPGADNMIREKLDNNTPADEHLLTPLSFEGKILDPALQPNSNKIKLRLYGIDKNKKIFDDTIKTSDSIEVQRPPGLKYTAASNLPDAVTINQKVKFRVVVMDTGGVGVNIRSANYIFASDICDLAIVDSLRSIDISGWDTLYFGPDSIPHETLPGSYTPKVYFSGIDFNGSTYRDSITLDASELRVFAPPKLEISADSFKPGTVTQGQSVQFYLTVTNKENLGVTLDTNGTTATFHDSVLSLTPHFDGRTPYIGGGKQATIFYNVAVIPDNFTAGRYPVTLKFHGVDDNGFEQDLETEGDTVFLVVQDSSQIIDVPGSLTPASITQGEDTSFILKVSNNGGAGITLQTGSARLVIEGSSEALFLGGLTDLPPRGDSIELRFGRHQFNSIDTGQHRLTLIIDAKDYNDQTIHKIRIIHDELNVQKPPQFIYQWNKPDTVSRGQVVPFVVNVWNIGGVTADIESGTLTFGNYSADLSQGSSVPPSESQRFQFFASNIDTNMQNTIYHAGIFLQGVDINGKPFGDLIQATLDSIKVDTPPDIIILPISSGNRDTVTVGDKIVPLQFAIENNGDADFIFNTDSLMLSFFGNNNIGGFDYSLDTSFQYQMTHIERVIHGHSTITIRYLVNIGNTDARDSLAIFAKVRGWDANYPVSDRPLKTAGPVFVHRWIILQYPVFHIDEMFVSDTVVTAGQTAVWSATLKVTNHANGPVLLESAVLQIYNGDTPPAQDFGYAQSLKIFDGTPGNTLQSESTATVTFQILQTGGYNGNGKLILRGIIHGTEIATGLPVGDSTDLSDRRHACVMLLKQGKLQYMGMTINQTEFDAAQTHFPKPPVTISCRIRNTGQRKLDLLGFPGDSLQFLINGQRDMNYRFRRDHFPSSLSGETTDSVTFIVDAIGSIIGKASVRFTVEGRSSGVPDSTDIVDTALALFSVERRGLVSLDSVKVLPPNTNVVATNKPFNIRVWVSNTGDDRVRNSMIDFTRNTAPLGITPQDMTIQFLDSSTVMSFDFEVTILGNVSNPFPLITAFHPGIADDRDEPADSSITSNVLTLTVQNSPPKITSVRFIDGGYRDIPDGRVDSGDVVKINFSENVDSMSNVGLDAARYFSIFPPMNTFGKTNSSIVKKASDVGYMGADSNLILFVEIHDTTARFDSYVYSDSLGTLVKSESRYTFEPTSIYINPAIDTGLIKGVYDNDVGYTIYRDTLAAQLTDTAYFRGQTGLFGRYSLIAEDKIPPIMLNFFPCAAETQKVYSEYSTIKAYITGRNLMQRKDLYTCLCNVFPKAEAAIYVDNDTLLTAALRKVVKDGNASNVRKLRDSVELLCKKRAISNTVDAIVDPFAQFYAPILTNSLVCERDTLPFRPNSPFHPDSILSLKTIENCGKCPGYNVVITNKTSMRKPGTVNVWFDAPVAGGDTYFADSTSFSVQPAEAGLKADTGYALRTAPNPFDPEQAGKMVIEYDLSAPGYVDLVIIDSGGRIVRKWGMDGQLTGRHRLPERWDGKNAGGDMVSRGVYLAIMKLNGNIKASWVIAVK